LDDPEPGLPVPEPGLEDLEPASEAFFFPISEVGFLVLVAAAPFAEAAAPSFEDEE
jgi:hypothetical protein